MNAIELEHAHKRFARRPAVVDLSLRVPRGSIFGLLGHNGAGKSTALGMVLGQVFPDRGTVRVHGHDVFSDRAAALGRVGAIFETPAFYDYLSGRRNLRIFCAYSGRASRRRVDEVVELVGLADRIDDRVAAYSHGMRQRLALAQALLPDPQTLILDEPSNGLDPEGIADMRRLIVRLHEAFDLTIVFSSHLLTEVEQLCTDVAVMHRGRLVFDGDWAAARRNGAAIRLEVDRRAEAVALLRAAGLIDGESAGGGLALSPGATSAAVNRRLVAAGFDVSAIGPVAVSLEDFYLSTVHGAAGGVARAARAGAADGGGRPTR